MTRQIMVGSVAVGGGARVSVQSMTNTKTKNARETLAQIERLFRAGCEIVRVSVPDLESAEAIKFLVDKSPVPLVADIHFNVEYAIRAIENGIHAVRVNPGNMGGEENVRKLCACLKAHRVPVRIGVNGGSLEKRLLQKYGSPCAEALVESALEHASLLENHGFTDIALSMKASDVKTTVTAYRLASQKTQYPLHVGVTETGFGTSGLVKSAMGIGALLIDGIGDTLRVSLTGDPVEEVYAGLEILRAAGLRKDYVEIISCPTCARTEIDVEGIAKAVREKTKDITFPLKIAVMGCVVNGPGEAREANIGIAGGKEGGALFRKGQAPVVIKGDLAAALLREIERMMPK